MTQNIREDWPVSAATDLGGGTGAKTMGNTAPGNWLSS